MLESDISKRDDASHASGPQERNPQAENDQSTRRGPKLPTQLPHAREFEVPSSSGVNSRVAVPTAPSTVHVTLGVDGHENAADTSHNITITDSKGIKAITNLNSKNDSSRRNIHIKTTTCNVYYGCCSCHPLAAGLNA
jgi:hypothetical protein